MARLGLVEVIDGVDVVLGNAGAVDAGTGRIDVVAGEDGTDQLRGTVLGLDERRHRQATSGVSEILGDGVVVEDHRVEGADAGHVEAASGAARDIIRHGHVREDLVPVLTARAVSGRVMPDAAAISGSRVVLDGGVVNLEIGDARCTARRRRPTCRLERSRRRCCRRRSRRSCR